MVIDIEKENGSQDYLHSLHTNAFVKSSIHLFFSSAMDKIIDDAL